MNLQTVSQLNNARRFATYEAARDAAAQCNLPDAQVIAFPRGYFVSLPGSGWGNDRWLADESVRVETWR